MKVFVVSRVDDYGDYDGPGGVLACFTTEEGAEKFRAEYEIITSQHAKTEGFDVDLYWQKVLLSDLKEFTVCEKVPQTVIQLPPDRYYHPEDY